MNSASFFYDKLSINHGRSSLGHHGQAMATVKEDDT